jgi:transcriptional regulator with XRE-family HTH domain
MTETARLVATLKRLLKQQGLTYRDIAPALGLSEASVKRLFASERFTLDRVVEVGRLLGYTLSELAQESADASLRTRALTEAQERELVSDIRLLVVAACVLNHWTMAEILAAYRFRETDVVRHLARLDRLRLIDLLPGNRIRLNVARDFEWRADGPIRAYFRRHWLADFLDSGFDREEEMESFAHGLLTEQALAQMQKELRRMRQRFAELHEESLASRTSKRRGMGLVVAMREWEPRAFQELRR